MLVPPRTIAFACGAAVALLGLTILAAWATGNEAVKQVRPDWPTMKANTAFGFLALGAALMLCVRGHARAGQVIAALAIAIGALTLVQYVAGVDLGIDEFLFKDVGGAAGTTSPGRLAILTAADFVLMGLAVVSWSRPTRMGVFAAVLAGFVALFNLAFYVLGAIPPIEGTRMAVHTAVGFLVLALGVLAARSALLADLFLRRTPTAATARRLMAPILLLPLVTAWTARQLVLSGRMSVDQARALALFANLCALAVLVGFVLLGLRREAARRAAAEAELARNLRRSEADVAALRAAEVEHATLRASLAASEARLRTIFTHSPVGIIITRKDGTVADLNPAAEALWRRPREDFLHADFRMQQLYADPAQRQAVTDAILRDGRASGLEVRMVRGDGRERTLRFNVELIQFEGEPVFLASGIDITPLRESEDRLKESEARLRAVLDNASDAIVTGDATATIVGWNRAAERIFALPADRAIGRSIATLLPPQQWADYQADIEQAMQGKPSRYIGHAREMKGIRGDGGSIDIELSLALWHSGSSPMFTGVVRDITERRQAQVQMQRANERFERVFRASPVPICLTKEDGRFVDVNEAFCALVGHTREALVAGTIRAPDVWEDPQERHRMLIAIRERGVVRDLEARIRRPDGEVRTTLASIEFIDLGGSTTILSLLQDITDRQRMQDEREKRMASEAELERLRRTDAFRAEFINNIAHELATPLTPLVLKVKTMLADPSLTPVQRTSIETLERNVDRLRHFVDDMVGAAHLQARDLSIDKRRLNVTRELRAAVAAHQPAAQRAGLAMAEPEDAGLTVSADPARLQLVLGHLLGNAIKFTPTGGRVSVEGRRYGDEVRIEVKDTGAGLTRKQMDGLWKPFAQAHDKSQRTDSGSGLGLYVTKGIVELHGGEVGCSSPGPGQGSTFWFTLPLAPGHIDPLARTKATGPGPEPRRNLNPGVAEDA